jgi:hypothetical protein
LVIYIDLQKVFQGKRERRSEILELGDLLNPVAMINFVVSLAFSFKNSACQYFTRETATAVSSGIFFRKLYLQEFRYYIFASNYFQIFFTTSPLA